MRWVYPIPVVLATFALLAAGCGGETGTGGPAPDTTDAARAEAPAVEGDGGPLVVFLGDSLSAGRGLAEDEAFPAILGRKLRSSGIPVRVVNAGVSGDTTAGGLRRLDWVLKLRPDVLVVELGGNDALRGQPLDGVEANLREIAARGSAAGARVLFLGMRVPTNYGPDYAEGFHAVYARVAKSTGSGLVPFLLEGVGGHPDLMMDDGIHPNARGHEIVAENVLPYLRRILATR